MSSSQGVESCTSAYGSGKGKQSEKLTKRHLSAKEEDVLLASLKELIARGGKSDNGFRAGYLTKLEALMKTTLPETDLKGIPHLNSKIQSWKRNYNSLTTMLSRSGIGFKEHMIDCTTEQWEEIVKADPNAKSMRRQSWPMYDDWKEIFGKDRANGNHAEDLLDAVNNLMAQDKQCNEEIHGDYHVQVDNLIANIEGDASACGSENGGRNSTFCGADSGDVTKVKGKKRKVRESDESVSDLLREMNQQTNSRLDKIAERIGYEFDLDKAKHETFELLETMPDLILDDRFYVCDVFAAHPERLLVFKGLPESIKPHYIQRLFRSKPAN